MAATFPCGSLEYLGCFVSGIWKAPASQRTACIPGRWMWKYVRPEYCVLFEMWCAKGALVHSPLLVFIEIRGQVQLQETVDS